MTSNISENACRFTAGYATLYVCSGIFGVCGGIIGIIVIAI